jgi:hypothetical protein
LVLGHTILSLSDLPFGSWSYNIVESQQLRSLTQNNLLHKWWQHCNTEHSRWWQHCNTEHSSSLILKLWENTTSPQDTTHLTSNDGPFPHKQNRLHILQLQLAHGSYKKCTTGTWKLQEMH